MYESQTPCWKSKWHAWVNFPVVLLSIFYTILLVRTPYCCNYSFSWYFLLQGFDGVVATYFGFLNGVVKCKFQFRICFIYKNYCYRKYLRVANLPKVMCVFYFSSVCILLFLTISSSVGKRPWFYGDSNSTLYNDINCSFMFCGTLKKISLVWNLGKSSANSLHRETVIQKLTWSIASRFYKLKL